MSPGAGPVLPSYQPKVADTDLENCAAACYLAKLSAAGILDGSECTVVCAQLRVHAQSHAICRSCEQFADRVHGYM